MIAIIKYKAGNIASVSNALDRLGCHYFFAQTPQELESARAVILPGVGHAKSAMDSLKELDLIDWLKQTKKPVLGICVGMQLMYEGSTEGDTEGLGVIPGTLQKFKSDTLKVPHMGWNTLKVLDNHHLIHGLEDKKHLYFVHSFYAPVSEFTIASCNYINEFSAAIAKDNFMGVQFHPEKSGSVGSKVLQNFLDLVYSENKINSISAE
jgi:glutamine amidotransferase